MFYQQDPPYQRGILLLDSVFRAYTYEWSDRGQMLAEVTQGVPVRTFTYNAAGQLVRATVFTLTTEFVYNGLGARVAVSVAGHGVTSYTLDLARGGRVLAESGVTSTVAYLYGRECLGEERDGEWLHYLSDAEGYVRQGADDSGVISSTWLFDPDGTVLEGPSGPVSHLICGGIYDWSTGLIYKGGRYFDPNLGIWLALMPLVVVQGWRGRKKKRGAHPWMLMVCLCLFTMGSLAGCCTTESQPTPTPTCIDQYPISPISTPTLGEGTETPVTTSPPTSTPTPTPTPTPILDREAKCSDFGMILSLEETQPAWNDDTHRYEKSAIITAQRNGSGYCPYGNELEEKCRIVQWVEGFRKVDGVPVPGMNNPGVYKVDVHDTDVGKPDYPAYERNFEYSGMDIAKFWIEDYPGQWLNSGQKLEVKERFITALYNTEDVDVGWATERRTKEEVLATSPIAYVEWNFIITKRVWY